MKQPTSIPLRRTKFYGIPQEIRDEVELEKIRNVVKDLISQANATEKLEPYPYRRLLILPEGFTGSDLRRVKPYLKMRRTKRPYIKLRRTRN